MDIPYVKKDLYQKHSRIFELINTRQSPILIQVKNIEASFLLNEFGGSPSSNFEYMQEIITEDDEFFDVMLQQTNFRLVSPIDKRNLVFWLIHVKSNKTILPDYSLYELNIN